MSSLLLARNKGRRKASSGEVRGFLTSCGRTEGRERNSGPQRVAMGVLRPKDGVPCLKMTSDSRMFN